MKTKDAISLTLEYYNELDRELQYFEKKNMNTDYEYGQLSSLRYILIKVYGFKNNDKRF